MSDREATVALDSGERRQVVQLLVADGGVLDVGTLAERLSTVTGGDVTRRRHRIELHHVHLPKLADSGLVVWDTEDGTVRPTATAKGVVGHADAPNDVGAHADAPSDVGAGAHGDD